MKTKTVIILSIALIVAVASNLQAQKQADKKHEHKTANEYMHQSSIEELANRFESPGREAWQQPEKVLAYMGPLKGLKIMDLGAGSGYFTIRLAKAGAHVIAADVNEDFQQYIKERIKTEKLEGYKIELRKIPYDSPDLARGEVDKVLTVNTYHHIEDRVDYFKKVLDGLDREGELIVIDYYKNIEAGPPADHKIAREKVTAELKEAGFKHLVVNTDLLPHQYIIKAKR